MADTKQKKYALIVTDIRTGKVLEAVEFNARRDAREERAARKLKRGAASLMFSVLPLKQGKIKRKTLSL